ncbi:ABC transporter ATP-binding protein [Pseudoclavibacter sp. RFBA6]|uniref:ABC transporter ATP-binding protein n=1 Tax=Pseudoclavibacter sp. RFBA6 TaxID=2080573 RepID=UPI000CE809CD|nr:ABC transporter ATP-binding protein [Pseudoclavibacter sp. RFBA6]PPG38119.1 ABC transporter ATP-binding protein [Pseudoclavibacter sp. RFBA6]
MDAVTPRPGPVLSVRNASRVFGGFTAVRDVSFDVAEGEILGIAGPNGAGKSTLFNLISGVPFGPSSGEIWFDGARIDRLRAPKIARRGLRRTFQSEQLFTTLTVGDNVSVSAAYLSTGMTRAARQESVDIAIDAVGIGAYRDLPSGEVPLLVKKKLMIASALVAQPRLLMLDEPAGGLDSEDQAELIELLSLLNSQGLTLLIIEHVLSLLRELAGRMVVMAAGSSLSEGTPEQALSDPAVVEAYLGGAHE